MTGWAGMGLTLHNNGGTAAETTTRTRPMTTLLEALRNLPETTIISDGGDTYDVQTLIERIQEQDANNTDAADDCDWRVREGGITYGGRDDIDVTPYPYTIEQPTITITVDDEYSRADFAHESTNAFERLIDRLGGVLPNAEVFDRITRMSRGRNPHQPRPIDLSLIASCDSFSAYRVGRATIVLDAASGESVEANRGADLRECWAEYFGD